MKNNLIGITRVLAYSGLTDYSFVQDDDLWRGSEIHRIIEFAAKGTLDRKSVPGELLGYLTARDTFVRETGFVSTHVEHNVEDRQLGVRGRIDAAGIMKGKTTIIDFKSGAIQKAVKYQLCLGAHLLNPACWWHRYAVQLCADGSYHVKHFPVMDWSKDLATALACVRVARAKIEDGLIKDL